MARAVYQVEALGLARLVVEGLAHGRWDDGVVGAVDEEQRGGHAVDLAYGVVGDLAGGGRRQESPVEGPHVGRRGEGRLQDDTGAGHSSRHVDGEGRPQGSAEEHEPPRAALGPRDGGLVGRLGIEEGARFRDRPAAQAVLPVVEEQDGAADLTLQQREVLQPVADVARVAVKPKQCGRPLGGGRGGREPSVEPYGVGRLEPYLLVGHAPVGRGADQVGVGEEDRPFVHSGELTTLERRMDAQGWAKTA